MTSFQLRPNLFSEILSRAYKMEQGIPLPTPF